MTPAGASRRALVVNPGGDVYGSDLQLMESIKGLTDRGWCVTLVIGSDGPLSALAHEHGVTTRIVGFPILQRRFMSARGLLVLGWRVLCALPAMLRVIREVDAPVVYVNTITIPWWLAAGRIARRRVLCHVHEAEQRDAPAIRHALYGPLFIADCVVANSTTSATSIHDAYPRLSTRSVVVRNGVPDRSVPPVPPPEDGEPWRFAVVSRLSPRKGLDVAIDAMRLLRDDGHDVRLEVAGSPFPGYEWFVDELQQQIHHRGLTQEVRLLGYVTPSSSIYDRSHVVLAPSAGESFGNTVVEGQLAQRPVVAAGAGGHLESIVDGRTGLLVAAGDPRAIATATAQLIDDPSLRRRMGADARRDALERFGVERYRGEVADTLRRLVEQTPLR